MTFALLARNCNFYQQKLSGKKKTDVHNMSDMQIYACGSNPNIPKMNPNICYIFIRIPPGITNYPEKKRHLLKPEHILHTDFSRASET